jgi:hypothetical protein
LAQLYEHYYYCRRDYPDLVRKVAQLVHSVGKGEYAVIATLLGLPKDRAIKGGNREMTECLQFKFHPGDGPTPESIAKQVRIQSQMTPEECVKFCVGIDAIKVAEKLSVDLRTGGVKGTVLPKKVSPAECQPFREEPADFATWCYQEKKDQKGPRACGSSR